MLMLLIVENDEVLAFVIQMILEAEGYEVRTAKGGWDGYFSYLIFKPDLVITDIDMPDKNGLEMMELIRRHDPKVKAIYMSGEPIQFSSLLEEEKKTYGASCLKKPFSKMELMTLITEHC